MLLRFLVLFAIAISAAAVGCSADTPQNLPDKAMNESTAITKQFIQAVKAQNLEAVLQVSSTPWFDPFEGRLITNRDDLKQYWQEKFHDLVPARIPDQSFDAEPYSDFRAGKGQALLAEEYYRKAHDRVVAEFDKVMEPSGWIVTIAAQDPREGMFVLVRVQEGKLSVVGGPAGCAYLNLGSAIPKDVLGLLDQAGRIEVLSLDPKRPDEKPIDDFHGYRVLGKTTIDDPATRRKLVVAFKQGVEENGGAVAGCFNPRHGIHVAQDGKTADFVICFECYSIALYESGTPSDRQILTTGSHQPVFDDILEKAGVPLAEKAEK